MAPLLFALLAISVQSLPATGVDLPVTIRGAVEAAAERVKPALVRIHVVSTDYSGGREIKSESTGSGAIVSEEGHVITNHHVAGHATRLTCTLLNKEEVEAELVGTDPLSDISVLRLIPKEPTTFPAISWGNSGEVKVGDYVLAMGSPLALSQSVTLGIVSNTEMVMPDFFSPFNRFILDGEDVGSIVLWIGHDADIYGGNSGGPLVNLNGEAIGINEMKMGLSGAIPGNLAREIADVLIEKGKVRRAWLGLEVQPQMKHSGPREGVLVSGCISGSPAEKAGFESGDILLEIQGTPVSVRFPEEMPKFNSFVTELPLGEEVVTIVRRAERKVTLTVTPVEREEARPKEIEVKEWGITVRNLSFMTAKEMKRETTNGVLVTSVRPGGPCGEAKPPVQSRDLIVEVSGTAVNNVKDFLRVTEEHAGEEVESVPTLTVFERKKRQYLTVVKVGIRKLRDPGLEVSKAWLPVAAQVLTRELAEQLGSPDRKGVRITQIYPHGDILEASLEVGDIVVALDGEGIDASEQEDFEVFSTLIRQYKPGTEVELNVLRKGEEKEVKVTLTRSPRLVREMKKYEDKNFEFTVRDIAFMDRASEDWDETQPGVLVAEVVPGSWAALGNLSTGDLILEVNGKPVENIERFKQEMKEVANAKPESLIFLVLRGIHEIYLEFEPKWKKGA